MANRAGLLAQEAEEAGGLSAAGDVERARTLAADAEAFGGGECGAGGGGGAAARHVHGANGTNGRADAALDGVDAAVLDRERGGVIERVASDEGGIHTGGEGVHRTRQGKGDGAVD